MWVQYFCKTFILYDFHLKMQLFFVLLSYDFCSNLIPKHIIYCMQMSVMMKVDSFFWRKILLWKSFFFWNRGKIFFHQCAMVGKRNYFADLEDILKDWKFPCRKLVWKKIQFWMRDVKQNVNFSPFSLSRFVCENCVRENNFHL